MQGEPNHVLDVNEYLGQSSVKNQIPIIHGFNPLPIKLTMNHSISSYICLRYRISMNFILFVHFFRKKPYYFITLYRTWSFEVLASPAPCFFFDPWPGIKKPSRHGSSEKTWRCLWISCKSTKTIRSISGWWFGTWLLFSISYMGCHPSH